MRTADLYHATSFHADALAAQAEARVSPTIHEGDSVRLRSGGPWMTIQRILGEGLPEHYALCAWFDHEQRLQTGTFAVAGLLPDLGETQPQGKNDGV